MNSKISDNNFEKSNECKDKNPENFDKLKDNNENSLLINSKSKLFLGVFDLIALNIGTALIIIFTLRSGLVGALVIIIYKLAGLTLPNAMYLLKPALETDNKLEAVLLSGYAIAIYMVLVATVVTIAYEKIIAYNKTKKPKHLAPIK